MQSGTTARIRATFGSGCGVNEDWGEVRPQETHHAHVHVGFVIKALQVTSW